MSKASLTGTVGRVQRMGQSCKWNTNGKMERNLKRFWHATRDQTTDICW